MRTIDKTVVRSEQSVLATNKVLKNTYALLAMTLLFSAATAGVSMALSLPHPGLLLTLVGYFGLLFATVVILVVVPCFFLIADDMKRWSSARLRHYFPRSEP